MTEKQILKKIDAWDDNDNIQAIVDFVENLPVEQRTTPVLSELGRAYNNLYWLDQKQGNEQYLRKAIDVFKYLEEELSEDASWNYRIGYSYFYLGEGELAKKHFIKERSLEGMGNDVETYLRCIDFAQEKGLSCVEVYNGGRNEVQYPLEMFKDFLHKNAPSLASILAAPASEEDIIAFEKQLGAKLPDSFKELHRSFSGQTENIPMFASGNQHFVSLKEIPQVQQKWLSFVEKHYGKNWQELQLDEENGNFNDGYAVKNTLYNNKWLPILAGETFLICIDLDPVTDLFRSKNDYYGQIIFVEMSEDIDRFEVGYLYDDIKNWLHFLNSSLYEGRMLYNEEKNQLEFAPRENVDPFLYEEEEREALENYIEQTFGKFDDVFHELESPDIHCDIYIIKPTPERNYYTLVTGGMGAFQMYMPEDYHRPPFAELVMNLPPTWDLKNLDDEKNYWPIRWLKHLARLPLHYQTFLGYGHTVPASDLEGTNFDCLMLVGVTVPSENEEEQEAAIVELPTGRPVEFFYVLPLYPEETNFKLDHNADDLLDKFMEYNIPYPPVVEINRPNVCEGYESVETPNLLDDVYWAFNHQYYDSLMRFWDDIKRYNDEIENELEGFAPFATIFNSPKVRLIYEAYIRNEGDLQDYEKLINTDTFDDEPEDDGLYYAEIVAELNSEDREYFGALNLLRHIHNTLANKDLGDHIFFEGFDFEGVGDDGVPTIYLHLGS